MAENNYEIGMSLTDYGKIISRRWVGALVLFLVGLGAALWLAFALPAVYESEGTILVEREEIPSDVVVTTVTGFVQERIESIRQRALTRDYLIELAERYDLFPDIRAGGDPFALVQAIRDTLTVSLLDINTEAGRRQSGSVVVAFTIGFAAETPEKAQAVVNEVMDVFLKENAALRLGQTAEVVEFLDTETARLQAEIGQFEQRIAVFKQENEGQLPRQADAIRRALTGKYNLSQDLTNRSRDLENQRSELASQLASLDPHLGSSAISGGRVLSPTGQLVQARVQLAEAREKYSQIHPEIRRLEILVSGLEKEVVSSGADANRSSSPELPTNAEYISVESRLRSANNNIAANRVQIADLAAEIAESEAAIATSPLVERDLLGLESELEGARVQYRDLRQKQLDARLALELERDQKGGSFSIVEEATYPSLPASPDRIGIGVLGALLGLILGLCWITLREYFDRAIRGQRGLLRAVGIPAIVTVPELATS